MYNCTSNARSALSGKFLLQAHTHTRARNIFVRVRRCVRARLCFKGTVSLSHTRRLSVCQSVCLCLSLSLTHFLYIYVFFSVSVFLSIIIQCNTRIYYNKEVGILLYNIHIPGTHTYYIIMYG